MMSSYEKPMSSLGLPGLAKSIADYEIAKMTCNRVDGQIIGTGKSDFTQGNMPYTLNYQGKIFELIDVPGIEGDESKFVGLVQEAVARAHLVFYVNGTNKKPEKATAAKIRSYLRRGSNVCPLVNVRGSADSYEFEEDRESLCQGGADVTLQQTESVLVSVLGEDVLLPGHCVQGLISFSSLAFDHESGGTTIHPSRATDLVRHQNNYLRYFKDTEAMYQFCQIESVAEILKGKLSTFREDIVESNKSKVRELLSQNISVLAEELESHKFFLEKVSPEFEKCFAVIAEILVSFERVTKATRRNVYNELFNKLVESGDRVVLEKFGEDEAIKKGIESAFYRYSKQAHSELEADLEKSLDELQTRLYESVARLLEDVERVELEQQLNVAQPGGWEFNGSGLIAGKLGLGRLGSVVFQVGTYTATGAKIGTPFAPPLGTVIGGAVGAALGIAMVFLNLFMSKSRRVRKSQAEVRKEIEKIRDKKLFEIDGEVSSLMDFVRRGVEENVVQQVDALKNNLSAPLGIIERQILLLNQLKHKIERMPYGTTQAI